MQSLAAFFEKKTLGAHDRVRKIEGAHGLERREPLPRVPVREVAEEVGAPGVWTVTLEPPGAPERCDTS